MDRLLQPTEVADMVGVKIETIYKWTREGKIPYKRVGKMTIRFDRAEVQEWLDKKTVREKA